MTKKRIGITDGGIAIPLGNNTFLMRGRLHSQGGIGIGNGGKNDIEVEDGEVVRFNKNNIQVLSDQPMLNGISPANALLAGGSFNKIFKAQQSINGNYGGSYGKDGLIKKLTGFFTVNNEKENANKENKKDAPIDWNEIKIKQAYTESGFNSKAVSKAPAYGLYQITPQTLKEFNDKTGNAYKVEDLYNDKINTEIRDWYMDDLYNREWNTKNNPSDSVRATKTIMAYNMGPTNLVNRLNELKAKGYDIYQSLDWTQDDSIPVESREYNDFILRNINNSTSRNQLAYETSKKRNSNKIKGIRNGFKNGGQINFNEDNVKNWINSWLNSRKNQLKENAKSTSFTYKNYKSLNNKGDIRDNGYDVTYEDNLLNPLYFLLGKNPNDIRTENIIKSQLYNIDNVATINVGDYYKPNYGKLGVYVNPNPWNNTGHYIAYKGVPLDGIRVHELTHASHPDQQIDYITDVIYKDRDIPVNKNGRQTNRDKAKEVYSAIQQYRFENGLKPEDIIDKTYIENNKNKIKSTPYLENINDDDLINIFNNVAKNDNKNKNNNVFYAKNGGQINMKLKYKNKQDITDMVMNEILPHSTGERKKFILGGSELALIGNAGLNFLSGLGQGIAGSINASKLRKMYDGLKRQSTFIPVAREHINTKVDVEPQLNLTAQTEYNLRRNAEMNTANAKVVRSQARVAALDRIRQDNAIYSDKYNRETQLRNAEAELQTKYNLVDLENKLTDIREQNDFDMQKAIGKANAGTMEAQTWGNAIASTLGNTATSLMDYSTMTNDLLKSNNTTAYDQWFKSNYGHLFDKDGKLKLGVNGDARKKWFNANKEIMDRLGYSLPS